MDRASRREFLQFLGIGTATMALSPQQLLAFSFSEKTPEWAIRPSKKDELIVANGVRAYKIISAGDPLTDTLTFGYNNDYLNFQTLANNELVMMANHEYFNSLFVSGSERTKEHVDIEQSMVGTSLMHLKKVQGDYKVVVNSKYNKGIRANTWIDFSNNQKIMNSSKAYGTLANCAGGKTDWGTLLTCEENYDGFYGERDRSSGERRGSRAQWEKFYPYPPEHYGMVVEINPLTASAKKHLSLGRFAHESATFTRGKNNKAVVYSGDDKKNEHLYKFISDTTDSLESGTLYVAKLESGEWLPLDLEKSPKLKMAFSTQQEVLLYAREAAKLLGATPLDRPEDIEIRPGSQDVFVALTNNKDRDNYHGSILKIKESGDDASSLTFSHETFFVGGEEGGMSCPDNMVFDGEGNLWVCSDISGSGMNKKPYKSFKNNGLFVIPASGSHAGQAMQVASAPVDAEFTGPIFSPDGQTLFLSVQHPGEKSESLDKLTSHWPDGGSAIPKPTVMALDLTQWYTLVRRSFADAK